VIKKYEADLAFWVSERDEGMYYAINKGFSHSSGDIMCWINSDDILWPDSLFYVADILTERDQRIHWLQGYPTVIDEQGEILYQRDPVSCKDDFYNLKFVKDRAFIQQESTFWTRDLWNRSRAGLDTQYKLAADFDLWMQFFHFEKLYCTHQKLGAFRKREGQKSADQEGYINEAKFSVEKHKTKLSFVDKLKVRYLTKSGKINWID